MNPGSGAFTGLPTFLPVPKSKPAWKWPTRYSPNPPVTTSGVSSGAIASGASNAGARSAPRATETASVSASATGRTPRTDSIRFPSRSRSIAILRSSGQQGDPRVGVMAARFEADEVEAGGHPLAVVVAAVPDQDAAVPGAEIDVPLDAPTQVEDPDALRAGRAGRVGLPVQRH